MQSPWGVLQAPVWHDRAALDQTIVALRTDIARPDVAKQQIVARIGEHLGGFAHQETGRGLDQRM